MKRLFSSLILIFAVVCIFPPSCAAQTDNTVYAKQFPGSDVGSKVKNATAACNPNTAIPCIIVLDPSLAIWPQGTMPALCAQCVLQDYRTGTGTAGSNGTISAVPGTGTITAAYAKLVASGNLGGSIFLPCGTYLDNFQPSEPVTISGAAQNCVGVEPLNKALPALGIQILAPITGYSVAAGGVATITAVNAFVAGQGPIILDSLATSPGSTCLNGDYTSIISATPTQFTIPSSCTAHAFQRDTGNAATENWNFEIDNVGIDCPGGSGCQDAIQLQGRVDKDWITDQRKIHAVTIGPGFTNGIHIIGRCISCTFDEIAVTAPTGVGFLADHAVPGCSGTTATCNTATGQGGLNQSEIDDSTFQSSGNYGVGLGDNTSTLTLGFIMNNVVSQGNGQTAANGSCASIFAENIDNLSIKNSYVEDDCTSGNNGAGSAEIRVTGLYSDGFRVENEQFDISESIPPIYTDSTYLSGYAGTNICVGGTSSVLKSNQEHGLSGGLFEWGQNDCGPPVSILNGNGVSGVASEPLNLGFRQMSSGTTVDATSQSLIQLYNGITLKNITGGSIGRRITLTNTYAASTIYNAAGGVGQIFTFSGANESLPGGFRDLICSSIDGTGCDWTEVGPISKDLANCGTMTTTTAATNALSCSWVTTSSNCTATQNSTTTIVPWTAVVPTAGTVTVTHTATAGGVYAIACSVN